MRYPRRLSTLVSLLLLTLGGCRDSSVANYRIPKEKDAPSPAVAASPHGSSAPDGMAGPQMAKAEGASLAWTAPAHWKAKATSSMRKGTYVVGDGAKPADLAISAFPGDVGGEVANVNRWRGQIDLAPLPDAEVPAAITRLKDTNLPVSMVDIVNGSQRMLAAFVPYEGATWFFKLTGPDALVEGEKTVFIEFLRSIRPAAAATNPVANPAPLAETAPAAPAAPVGNGMADTAVAKASGPDLKWTAPAQWQAAPVSTMRKGTYVVTDGTSTADLAITAFPGDVGGDLANVNRWRGQLQLPPIEAAELPSAIVRRQQNGLTVGVVDLVSAASGQRLLGGIVPYNGATWFFKLVGPDALVAREKPTFLAFLETIQTP